MTTQAKGKSRLVPLPKNYTGMESSQAIQLIARDLKTMVRILNDGRLVSELAMPWNVNIEGGGGYAALSWDDVADDSRFDVYGMRIWRANAAEDADTNFFENSAKIILVDCVHACKYVDVEVGAGDYVYWMQWVNTEGKAGRIAGGFPITVVGGGS
jgi:hypothetical protein